MTRDYYAYLAGGLIILASLLARYLFLEVMTDDYIYFLQPWFRALADSPGFSAFRETFSNYPPLYLYLLKFLTLFPVPALYSIKLLSILFDAVLAFLTVAVIRRARGGALAPAYASLIFAAVFSLPTVILNSAMWAQSDAIYVSLILASLYFILRDRPRAATLMFALSFSFKLQAIFFLPVLIGYLWRRKSNPLYLLLIPAAYVLSLVPAWISGGSLRELLLVYAGQAGEYADLTLAAPTIFAFLNPLPLSEAARGGLALAGILAAALAALGLIVLIKYRVQKLSGELIISLSLLSVLLIPFLLPRMHERYFYLADILALAYAFFKPRAWYLPVLAGGASLLAYAHYLSAAAPWLAPLAIDLRWPAALILAAIVTLGAGTSAILHRHFLKLPIARS